VAASTIIAVLVAAASWLDQPLSSWNQAVTLPAAPAGSEAQSALAQRCGSTTLSASTTAEAVRKAGWVPFQHLDRALAREDVEVLGGMISASPGCEPTSFNVFVFVGGRFAGTLSPSVMTQNRDGVAGAVRIITPAEPADGPRRGSDAITAEFARYGPTDPECCPSSRVRVTYRIERTATRTTLVATEARQIR
jgi:hypothetical protein